MARPDEPKADYLRWLLVTMKRGAWAPMTVIIVHLIALLGLNAYEHFPPIDIPMHFFGGMSAAYFLRWILATASECGVGNVRSSTKVSRLVLAMTFGVTVVWELMEFWLDQSRETKLQLGPIDTITDMILGTLGGLLLLRFQAKKSRA